MHRYNEKTDVYSFGVMMFEVFSRNMLVMMVDVALRITPGTFSCNGGPVCESLSVNRNSTYDN